MLQFEYLWSNYSLTVWRIRISFEVVFVIWLSRVENFQLFHLCDYGFVPYFLSIEFIDNLVSCRFLLRVLVENCWAVLGANVRSLLVDRCRIMGCKEYFKYFFVGNGFGVEGYLCSFCVPCCSGWNLFICGIREMTSRVSRSHFFYAFNYVENCFNTPEAASCKCGNFRFLFFLISQYFSLPSLQMIFAQVSYVDKFN